MSELLRCPFCDGEAMRNGPAMRFVHGVHCRKCKAELTHFDTQREADAAWNTRAALRNTAQAQVTEADISEFEGLRANVNQFLSHMDSDLADAWEEIETWMESKLEAAARARGTGEERG